MACYGMVLYDMHVLTNVSLLFSALLSLEQSGDCPMWFALSILIGGLLLDMFVTLSLGVSALPVNIVIGKLL